MHLLSRQNPFFAAISLAILMTFQSVGWFMAWQGMQLGAKLEAQLVLFKDVSALQQSSFHRDFFNKIKVDAREIRLNGQLFDYRILSVTGDSIRVALYHDRHEQALLSTLGLLFQSADNSKSPSTPLMVLWLAKWLGASFLLPEKPGIAPGQTPDFQKQNFIALQFPAQFAPGVFSPPPEA